MKFLRRIYNSLRFGKVTTKVVAYDGGYASEIQYLNKKGKVVGWKCYGYFDPNFPYKE